jgi:hypothetical protein
VCQVAALPQVKSNRSKSDASRQNQTMGKTNNTGIPPSYRSTYGVDFERTKKIDTAYRPEISESRKTGENRNPEYLRFPDRV